MDYRIVEGLLQNIFSFAFENKIILIIFWIALMFILLKNLSKKDNEWYLKDFFKKK